MVGAHFLLQRFKTMDVPTAVSKVIPGFCTVYVIAKGKVQSTKNASSPVPSSPTPVQQNHSTSSLGAKLGFAETRYAQISSDTKGLFFHLSVAESDLSFVSSGRPSSTFPISMDSSHDLGLPPRLSNSSDTDVKYSAPRLSNSSETESRLSFGSSFSATRLSEANGFSSNSFDSGNGSWSSPSNMVCISTSTTGVSSKSN